MGKRWMMGLVAIVAVIAVGGIGYAAFSTTAYVNGVTKAGTLGPLIWTNASSGGTGTETFDQCTDSIGMTTIASDTFFINSKNLAPGDSCTFNATITNHGSIPANTYLTGAVGAVSTGCGVISVYDSWFGYEHAGVTNGPKTLNSGVGTNYIVTSTLNSGLGNSWQGTECDFVLTLSATAGI